MYAFKKLLGGLFVKSYAYKQRLRSLPPFSANSVILKNISKVRLFISCYYSNI